jgi:cyclopropane-fatty-acyl-phospholipid synthase
VDSSQTVAAAVSEVLDRAGIGELPFATRFWDGSEIPAAAGEPPRFTVLVEGPSALAGLLREPNQLGLGRAWVTGGLDLWGEIEDVFAMSERFADLRLGWRARLTALGRAWRLGALGGALRPFVPASESRPGGRAHSLRRDRRAITHHYDISNEFYRLVLGSSLVYSCAYFDHPEESLEGAQERKLDLICRKLVLGPGERFLDIGCGWGSLLIHAAGHYGVRAVGVTISGRQASWRGRGSGRPASPTAARSGWSTTGRSTTAPTTRSPASGCMSMWVEPNSSGMSTPCGSRCAPAASS